MDFNYISPKTLIDWTYFKGIKMLIHKKGTPQYKTVFLSFFDYFLKKRRAYQRIKFTSPDWISVFKVLIFI
jgi:hypothetical protein